VGLAIGLAAIVLITGGGMVWTVYLLRTGCLDAQGLAEKTAVPQPVSALDWPELKVRAVVSQPDGEPLVLLHVDWPAFPQRNATLLMALDKDDQRSLPLLSTWCTEQVSVSPTRRYGSAMELRKRQSLQRVRAVLVTEDLAPKL
jgi:hypothetical protein